MLTFPTEVLLQAWERGHDASPGEHGLILLTVAYPDVPVSELRYWPVGRRDAALFGLFDRLFGSRLSAQAECPHCSAELEMDFPISTFSLPTAKPASNRFVLQYADYRLTYRLPTAGDLATLGVPGKVSGSVQTRSRWLLRQCVLDVSKDRQSGTSDEREPGATSQPELTERADALSANDIPDEVLEALASAVVSTASSVDPLAEVELKLDCPECAFSWQASFDIVSFLWSELDVWAKQMLREIHILASNYGWSEANIIALSPERRQHYRGLIGT